MKPTQACRPENLHYLKMLARQYPTVQAASTEIINLQAILNLPKGTEHFVSDVHGEYEAFLHILNSASGVVREKLDDLFAATVSKAERDQLATLIYYPKEKLEEIQRETPDMREWYRITFHRLIEICRLVSSKYTRSKVRKAMPREYAYIIDEMLHTHYEDNDKRDYYENIISTIIDIGRASNFLVQLCELIKRLAVDHLHVVGDIFDRGPRADIILDSLLDYHSVDIQWGNHDVLWMGAAAGQKGCIANAIRICARYGNLDILEEGYGINLLPLATFSLDMYGDDPCTCFALKGTNTCSPSETELNIKMHKAISVIQFKVEGQLAKEHPEFQLENRNLLHLVDYGTGSICLNGTVYEMLDSHFPTVDPQDPYRLTAEEELIMERLVNAFRNCEKLQQHMRFLLAKGSLYKVYNGNLLYHGCIPLNRDGSFKEVDIYGQKYKGKSLYECLDGYVRKAFMAVDPVERARGRDICWYIWLHQDSPLFGKDKMATFERYFLADKETHREEKNPYYCMLENEDTVGRILEEFGLSPQEGHIVNGHVPVKSKNGENPVKCGGKVLVIDGGFSRAYQKETGIAGYTLIYNSYGLILAAHEPFESTEAAIEKESDIHSESTIVKRVSSRKLVGDTDVGKQLKTKIKDLEMLLEAYHTGRIVERFPVR